MCPDAGVVVTHLLGEYIPLPLDTSHVLIRRRTQAKTLYTPPPYGTPTSVTSATSRFPLFAFHRSLLRAVCAPTAPLSCHCDRSNRRHKAQRRVHCSPLSSFLPVAQWRGFVCTCEHARRRTYIDTHTHANARTHTYRHTKQANKSTPSLSLSLTHSLTHSLTQSHIQHSHSQRAWREGGSVVFEGGTENRTHPEGW